MPATLHHTTFVIRAGPDHHRHGDPYTFACCGVVHSSGVVELIAAVGQPTPSMWRDVMVRIANEVPCATVCWFERKDANGRTMRASEINLERYREAKRHR